MSCSPMQFAQQAYNYKLQGPAEGMVNRVHVWVVSNGEGGGALLN